MITDRALLKALERGESVSEISQYQNKRGEYFPVAITASPILLNGKPTGCIEIFRDITKQKEAERSQREHSKEVERMNKFMVDREVKMSELKQEMERLRLENEDLKKLIVR